MSVSKLPKTFKTFADVGRGLHEVHGCVHAVGEEVKGVREDVGEISAKLTSADEAIKALALKVAAKERDDALKEAYRAGAIEAIGKTVGAPLPQKPGDDAPVKTHRRILGMRVWQFWTALFGAIGGFQLALKIVDKLPWTPIWHAILNTH